VNHDKTPHFFFQLLKNKRQVNPPANTTVSISFFDLLDEASCIISINHNGGFQTDRNIHSSALDSFPPPIPRQYATSGASTMRLGPISQTRRLVTGVVATAQRS
jgi:hypothetical protein